MELLGGGGWWFEMGLKTYKPQNNNNKNNNYDKNMTFILFRIITINRKL